MKQYFSRAWANLLQCSITLFTDSCGDGWEKLGDKCFYFSQTEIITSFTVGEEKCKSLHPFAHLASIQSKKEQDFIVGKTINLVLNLFECVMKSINDESSIQSSKYQRNAKFLGLAHCKRDAQYKTL